MSGPLIKNEPAETAIAKNKREVVLLTNVSRENVITVSCCIT
jgi:hypothetical protein